MTFVFDRKLNTGDPTDYVSFNYNFSVNNIL